MKKTTFVVAAVAVVAGFLIAAAWYRQSRSSALEEAARERAMLFVRPHSPVRGAETARVDLGNLCTSSPDWSILERPIGAVGRGD
jgi:hypothetical protein